MNKKHIDTFARILILGLSIIVIAGLVVVSVTRPRQAPVSDQSQAKESSPISFDNLSEGQGITRPFVVTGEVTGWFFEGSFPVFMYDNTNNQIGVALASSSQDWMTSNPVPFSVTIPQTMYQGPGTLVFTKDNPSGEPQFDASYTVNVIFQ